MGGGQTRFCWHPPLAWSQYRAFLRHHVLTAAPFPLCPGPAVADRAGDTASGTRSVGVPRSREAAAPDSCSVMLIFMLVQCIMPAALCGGYGRRPVYYAAPRPGRHGSLNILGSTLPATLPRDYGRRQVYFERAIANELRGACACHGVVAWYGVRGSWGTSLQ